jgi:hypothetical protein
MCTQVVIHTALCVQIRHSGGDTSKTCSAPCDTETALTEAADHVTQTYDRLDRWAEFNAHGRATQDGSDLPRLGRAKKIPKIANAY